jgi:UDP-glucose 4-epimerase
VRRLQADGREIRIADSRAPEGAGDAELLRGDLRDYGFAREAVRGCDQVIHLAAIVGGIGNFHKYPFTLLENNHGLYNAIFRAAIEEQVERFVYVSSSMVFENANVFPTSEHDLRATPAPWSAYGFSKLAGEVYCRAANDEHGLRYTICRPFNAYGPGEMPEDEPGIAHMVPDVIRKVLAGRKPLQIFGSGEQTRTLTYVDDIANGIVTAMESEAGVDEDFNISAADEMTVAQIARIIWEECGKDPEEFELEHLGSFEVDVQRRWPDVSKAERLLGWRAEVPVREGIRRTVDWLRERV